MIKWMMTVSLMLSIVWLQPTFAKNDALSSPGPLFNVTASGTTLTIRSTPNWFYQFAGLKILTSGYTPSNCTPSDNGYCLFPVSNTGPRTIPLSGPLGTINLKLCLNGVGGTFNCESYSVVLSASALPTIQSTTGYTGIVEWDGIHFIPGLGTASSDAQVFISTGDPSCTPSLMTDPGFDATINDDTSASPNLSGAIIGSAYCSAICINSHTGAYTGQSTECTNAFYQSTP